VSFDDTWLRELYDQHQRAAPAPSPEAVARWVEDLLRTWFPQLRRRPAARLEALEGQWAASCRTLTLLLEPIAERLPAPPAAVADAFCAAARTLRAALLEDANAIYEGDPAATDVDEVIRVYPGFLAIASYRVAHHFHGAGVPVLPRTLTEHAHARTGIDIHPGARIGRSFCIDHGTGIVIGETTEIGNRVKIYQGVTLGALSVSHGLRGQKRHPTVEDDVVIYANATILGGETVVGRGSVIGGNVWVLASVPPGSKVLTQPTG
jgi:serine O-acetyltransferase